MPNNQSFYRQIAGYRMDLGDHRVGRRWKGIIVMVNKIVAGHNWGAFDHASHAPQLRSFNYNNTTHLLPAWKAKVQSKPLILYGFTKDRFELNFDKSCWLCLGNHISTRMKALKCKALVQYESWIEIASDSDHERAVNKARRCWLGKESADSDRCVSRKFKPQPCMFKLYTSIITSPNRPDLLHVKGLVTRLWSCTI